ncbi:ABC transporter substrate-binding protein [Cumulibacter manganitolerans]|uniref:ABC transporter substrate-binding protein n=1 Tax=Cumulibacter manganitolerans TaxID=1884992 RepID=UPI001296FD4A|nr:ABC transporter substrate-binding protein [Cumulibacter manganitolerans]
MNKRVQILCGLSAALALTVTGCSNKAKDDTSSSGGGSGSVKTDVGITDKEILLGVQSDLSGVFKSIGLGLTHGNEMWANAVNSSGGVCGRQIKLDIQDNGYKADNAVPLYETQKTKVAGFVQLIGSPVLAALKTKIVQDQILTIPAAQASSNMGEAAVLLIGATYDVEMVNGLAWLQEQGKLADGDKIGHIYIDSEYGQNGLLGSKAYAKDHKIQVVEAPVAASDTDLTATITKMKSEGVKAIALTVTPAGTASAAVQNVAQGLNVPLLGNDPTFSAEILKDQTVANAVSKNMYVSAGTAAFGAKGELLDKIKDEYLKKYPQDTPNYAVNAGYLEGLVWQEVLKQACSDGDMTRAGLVKARTKVTNVNGQGISGNLDLSDPGNPTPRSTFIEQPDPATAAQGGLKVLKDAYESKAAKDYKAPHQK